MQKKSQKLFKKAKRYLVGGVNSPVRSFGAVGGYPLFMKRGKGSKIYAEEGSKFIDYCLSWGALILGHAHPRVTRAVIEAVKKGTSFGTATKLEIELAKLIAEAFPTMEQIRFTNSGGEAAMGALKLAKAFTGRKKIIKFRGGYHGWSEQPYLEAEYNDLDELRRLISKEVAAIVVEPVAGNRGVILPKPGFLAGLRKICNQHKMVLIFDEVITGFRFCWGGAQKVFKLKPDLTCLGKVIGGGLPAGAFGGKKEIMQLLAPSGNVLQAGTFSGNPVTVSAGIATLQHLKKKGLYSSLERKTKKLCQEIEKTAKRNNIRLKINNIDSMFSFFLDRNLFRRFYRAMLEEGIYFSPSEREANFMSLAHSAEDINKTIEAVEKVFAKLRRD